MDVLEIDGASNRGIDEVRELRETVKYAPASSRFKIYIIDEVHMLTKEAFNALVEDAGGTAGACEIHVRHHRAGEGPADHPFPLPAFRSAAHSGGA